MRHERAGSLKIKRQANAATRTRAGRQLMPVSPAIDSLLGPRAGMEQVYPVRGDAAGRMHVIPR